MKRLQFPRIKKSLFTALSIASLILTLLTLGHTQPTPTQTPELQALKTSGQLYAVLDKRVQISFEPISVTALLYDGSRLRQYDAEFLPTPEGVVGGGKIFRVAAVVPVPPPRESSPEDKEPFFDVTFFLSSIDGDYAATTVERWTYKQLQENTKSREQLEKEFLDLQKEIPKQRARNDSLEQELERTRDRASQVSDLADIVGLQNALNQLQSSDSTAANEIELQRLRELISRSRELPVSVVTQEKRLELSLQLKEMALATATTEHIRSLRKQSASSNYFRKLELARQAEGVDIRGLATKVLSLRQKRKELESRLGVRAAELLGTASSEGASPANEAESQQEF